MAKITNAEKKARASKRATAAPARTTDDGEQSSELKECKAVLEKIMAHKHAWPFNRPVDVSKYVDYLQVVTAPMDLGTIKKRLHARQYANLSAFTADMEQIWRNCHAYNPPGDEVCMMATELQQFASEALAQIPKTVEAQKAEAQEKQQEVSVQRLYVPCPPIRGVWGATRVAKRVLRVAHRA